MHEIDTLLTKSMITQRCRDGVMYEKSQYPDPTINSCRRKGASSKTKESLGHARIFKAILEV